MSEFNQFDLDESILKALKAIGFDTPTPIQEKAIPLALEGKDIIASAQTGTGKTAAFMLPLLNALVTADRSQYRGPKVLVLVPTRELAMQVEQETKKYSNQLQRVKAVSIYGGVPYFKQKKTLSRPYDILVATPGRLIDTMDERKIDLSSIEYLVLDEADRMLDMGFIEPVEKIVAATAKKRQTLLFSATLSRKILDISKKFQNSPCEIKIKNPVAEQSNIEKRLYYTDDMRHKSALLETLLEDATYRRSIIFTSTKRQADVIARDLQQKGHIAEPLHGDLSQRQRTRTVNGLRQGKIDFIIATDVAARGIDIPQLSFVINYDLPYHPEDFIHRIGRTGRAGADGIAITFATYREAQYLSKIEKLLSDPMEVFTVEGLEPKQKKASFSSPRNRKGPSNRGQKFRGDFSKKPSQKTSQSRNKPFGNRTQAARGKRK
ncbi:MAG: DEAD/DEAH box helicase [Simkaniaceae bacterium]|nr:DEAD/DEAH box helicase [Simkaniaceae bacterium]